MHRSSVDLPDPDGPMMHTASPLAAVSEMPRSTSVVPNDLWTSTSRRIGTSSRGTDCERDWSAMANQRGFAGTSITRGTWPVAARKRSRSAWGMTIVAVLTSGCACTASASHSARSMTNSTARVSSLTRAKRLTEPGVIPRYFFSRSAEPKPNPLTPSHRRQGVDVDGLVVRHGDEQMAPPFLVAEEQVLRLRTGKFGHQTQRLLHGHHRRMLVPDGMNAVR